MRNINTQVVFLGIDVHKRTYSVTAVSENVIVKKASMPADPNALLAFIHKFFPNSSVYTVYEAGFSGYGLHRFLLAHDAHSIVTHAASIETAAREKVKNDSRDSEKMAFQLSYGKLTCVNIPSPQREFWRSITRLRSQLVREKTRIASKIKGLLHYFSLLPYNHTKKTSRKWVKSLLKLENINEDVFFSIQMLAETWLYFDDRIKIVDKRLKTQAKSDFETGSVYLQSHGIGLTTSRILANELGDLSQFHTEASLYSYTGLTPREHSSGDKRKLGHISRQGNTIVRGILTEVAWKAIRKDSHLAMVFERLVRNTASRKKAILGVARRIIGHIRAKFEKIKRGAFMY